MVCGISDTKYTKIFSFKILNQFGDSIHGSAEELINAIHKAEMQGCDICNISMNTEIDNQELKECIEKSEMLFVVSAGNGEKKGRNIDEKPSYPAAYEFDNLITVANIKSNGKLNSKSNYGDSVDVAAPGTEIFNITSGGCYSVSSGTSLAAPVVTGLASMLYICDEKLTAKKCKSVILSSSNEEDKLDDKIDNNRVVNMFESLKLISNM